jgi:hypothetical protein
LLKFVDKEKKVIFVLRDEDSEPVSIDELIIKDENTKSLKKENKDHGTCKQQS